AKGVPHVVPVCPVVEAGRLYFASGKTGRKMQNLRANAQVAMAADDYTEAWGRLRGVVVSGTARAHARNTTFRRIRRRLHTKYPQVSDGGDAGRRRLGRRRDHASAGPRPRLRLVAA